MSSGNFKINDDHWLEKADGGNYLVDHSHKVSSKNKTPFAAGTADSIVIHYTAGRSGDSSAKYMARPNVKASAHLVIDRDGKVYQLAPFNIKTWHAGKSAYNGRKYYNHYSVGIEIDNAGILTPAGNKFKSWFGATYDAEDVVKAVHRNEKTAQYWHTYTQKQIDICEEIVDLLLDKYPAMMSRKEILGHEEISPGRKQDPGPAFPLDRLREAAFSNDRAQEDDTDAAAGVVAANRLNIRQSPSGLAEKVAKPLLRGHEVEILETDGDWYKVSTKVTGWVSKKFIEAK